MPITRSKSGAGGRKIGKTPPPFQESHGLQESHVAGVEQSSPPQESNVAGVEDTRGTGAGVKSTHDDIGIEVKVSRASSVRPRSMRSSIKSHTKRVAEARERLARAKLDEARAVAALAEAEMAIIVESSDDELESIPDQTKQINGWLEAQPARPETPVVQGTSQSQNIDVSALATALIQAARTTSNRPPKFILDLPSFNGASGEWLSFKASYRDTKSYFNRIENLMRLKKSLRGTAKEAAQSLFIAEMEPDEVMKHLEVRFGRADALVISEVEKMKGLPKLTDNPRDVCIFSSRVNNIVAVVKSLNKIHYLYNPETVRATVDKMTSAMKYRWYDYAVSGREDEPDLIKLSSFLSREAELCSRFAQAETPKERDRSPKKALRAYATSDASNTDKPKKRSPPPQANQIEAIKNVTDRWEEAKKLNLCFRCLHKRDFRHRCPYRACATDGCQGSHHPLLHSEKPALSEVTAVAVEERGNEEDTPEVVTTNRPLTLDKAFLKVIPIKLQGPTGAVDTFALLDEGSTVTLIEDEVAQAIGAVGPKEPFDIEGIAGAKIKASSSMRVSLRVTDRHATKEHKVRARTINRLHLSPQTIDESIIEQCEHLQDIANDLIYRNGTPALLIGQDNWHLIVSRSVKSGKRGQPVASLTELGWVLHGSYEGKVQRVHIVTKLEERDDDRMEELMKSFFDLDNLGVEPRRPQNNKDARALAILEQRSRRLPDGRFETGLLWRDESIVLPNNRETAVRRLYSIERKLERSPELKEQYYKQMAHLIESGYAEKATKTPQPGRTWYLPHFAVINPSKPKPRIVLDAAARTHGLSLNDCLLTGPDLLQSLPGVLMRFRQRAIAVTADIQEMFLRISIREEDRDALRFLWREKVENPTEYRMKSVIFGAASSPCTAIFIKNKNAEEHRSMYPEAAEAISKNHYMDDYCHSFNTIEEAIRVASNVDHVHKQAKFYLRKWASNRPEVIKAVAPEQIKEREEVKLNDGQVFEKTLGLIWKPHEDVLAFNLNLKRVSPEVLDATKRPTKREVLRTIMSLFDPLGLVTPVIMPAKRLLQDTWRLGVGWDDELPVTLHAAWCEWLGHLRGLQRLSIARCYPCYASATHLEMHIFVDASSTACVAACYWRAVTERDTVLSLTMAKGKVAPLKTTSIPRLELQAAVLGCRLARTVEREHDIVPARRVFWTDSRTVLAWLRTGPRAYKPFVAHRLAEIEEDTKVCEWRWVPTAFNVADDATRGPPNGFGSDHRWFRGPNFLYHPEDSWPREPKLIEETSKTGEERVATTRGLTRIIDAMPEAARFSSWLRLVRATGRVLQFIDLCRARHTTAAGRIKRTRRVDDDPAWKTKTKANPNRPVTTAPPRSTRLANTIRYITLEAQYVRAAEKLWWRAVQEDSFGDDLRRLRQHLTIERDSPLRALSVLEDEEGVLRLKSRIDAALDLPEERRHPPILHGEHAYTRLYIAWVHKRNHHAGTETVVNEIRSHLWVLRLRPITRTIVRRCITCRILRAKPAIPATGDHPITRLAHHQRPFTYVGLDYFGPYSVTVGRRHEKRYVALFTCLTTRAIHLEVAGSLSTDSAIMALRRMMARRGCPTEIHSDNGSNLRGADAELQKAAHKATKDEATIHAIMWRYIPPGAPFMGGAWERMVQCVKRALAATLIERHPSEEVLTTLLLEAEYTVNNRPLTPVSTSPDDPEALTPLHFILGGPARVPLPGTFNEHDLKTKHRWRHTQRLADIFWARWIREYAPLLQCRREPYSRGRQPQLGDVVLIIDESLPRNTWAKGRVIEVHPGRDGTVRVVDVATKAGIRRRATKKLVVLTE